MSTRVLIGGGGTGGHLFPALAVADHLRAATPPAEVLFVGSSDGLERRLVPQQGYELQTLAVGKVKGARRVAQARALAAMVPASFRALQIVRRFAPQVVMGVGGYASAPVALAAWLTRRPVVLLEQNAIPGATNRALARVADRVVISFAGSARFFPAGRTVCLGNPVRAEIVEALRRRPRSTDRDGPSVLVLGGSQGAHRVNELLCEAAPRLFEALPALRLHHQTGESDLPWVKERYRAWPGARASAFITDMADAYAEADLVIGRAGATTLAELAIAGTPAYLIPYPFAADDHQAANAEHFVEAGAALMVRQEQLDAARLTRELLALLGDRPRLEQMGRAMQRCGHPEAAAEVVALLQQLAR